MRPSGKELLSLIGQKPLRGKTTMQGKEKKGMGEIYRTKPKKKE